MPRLNTAQALAAYETAMSDRRRDAAVDQRSATASDTERGVVRFFDPRRGIGYVISDQGDDVFLGGRAVSAAGIDPWPGDTVEFEREPPNRDGGRPSALRPKIVEVAKRARGTVRFWASEGSSKGHGFIAEDADPHSDGVFVNGSMLAANGVASLRVGQRVEFFAVKLDKHQRPIAQRIRVLP